MKKIIIIGLAVLLCGCSQNSDSSTSNEYTVTNTNSSNEEAYTLIHDGLESLDTLDSYSYTMTSLYYVPTIESSIQIKSDQYKIKNNDGSYSGASLSDTYYYDLTFSQKQYETISTSSFDNSDTKQEVTNVIENGTACSNACTSSLTSDNSSQRSLLSPKETLYDTILGEKTGFLRNVYLNPYEESTQLKETYKTKDNYLQSFIDEKQATWNDLSIESTDGKKVISYTVSIELGVDYLNSILENQEDEDSIQFIQNQIDGNETYVEKIERNDQITINSNGVFTGRKQTYKIYTSDSKTKVLTFNDKVDTTKVTAFNFDDVIVNSKNNTVLQLAGTYMYTDENGNTRLLIFNNQAVTIEEGNSVLTGTYTITGTKLQINITNDQGKLNTTELYTISNTDGTLTDSKGNVYYYYVVASDEEESEEVEESAPIEEETMDEEETTDTETIETEETNKTESIE